MTDPKSWCICLGEMRESSGNGISEKNPKLSTIIHVTLEDDGEEPYISSDSSDDRFANLHIFKYVYKQKKYNQHERN